MIPEVPALRSRADAAGEAFTRNRAAYAALTVAGLIAQLAVAQTRHRIVFVEALLRLRRRFDVPGNQVSGDPVGDLMGEDCLTGPRLSLDEQRALECDRGIDRHPKVLRSDIRVGALET